jgi:tetratricopeptide (TPR) repeat protein
MAKRKGSGKGAKKGRSNAVAQINRLWQQARQLAARGNQAEVERTLLAILALAPGHYGSLVKLADMALGADKKPLALNYAKKAVQANHGDAAGHLVLGRVLADLGLTDMAEAELTIAQQLNAEDSRIPDALGWVLAQQGRSAEAETAYRRAIALAPKHVGAYYNLAANKKFQPDDPDIAAIEQLREHAEQFSQEEKAALYFTLAKVHHDCGEYDQAFAELQRANRLKRVQLHYRSESQRQLADLMLQAMDAAFAQRLQDVGCPADSPVFVVGMPRSGTTLVESLLCRHPDVSGIGEVPYISNLAQGCGRQMGSSLPYPQFLSQLPPPLCRQLGEDYVRLTHQFGVNAARIVDKTPGNFMLVGFILALLPKARIIHCVRNPLDTCLSIYQQYFTSGMGYAYDLKDIGEYYVQYRRFMDYWQSLYPDRICQVVYEDVVADSEQSLRRMIDYCALPWDERCLQAPGEEVKIRTASVWQARQPVYDSSVQRWRHYQKHLGPLLEALQPVLVEGAF